MTFRTVSLTRSYEHVVRQIEEQIRGGQFARGQRLPTERELGLAFGVSRGVVREAVKVLDAMGLVEARQGSGLYVRNNPLPTVTKAFTLSVHPDAESVELLFEFRRELEVSAARLAAIRASDADTAVICENADLTERAADTDDIALFGVGDQTLHLRVAEAAGNPYLTVAIKAARDMQHDVVHLFTQLPGSMAIAAKHHQAIAAAIAARDSNAAGAAMAEHINYTASASNAEIWDESAPRRQNEGRVKPSKDGSHEPVADDRSAGARDDLAAL